MLAGGQPAIDIVVILTALEFVFIFYLETIATTSKRTASVFNMEQDELKKESVSLLFKNQGVYNLIIAVMLPVSLFLVHSKAAVVLFLVNIIAVAAYGDISLNPRIFFKQGTLAVIALILVLVAGI